jgi:hypothetical protein
VDGIYHRERKSRAFLAAAACSSPTTTSERFVLKTSDVDAAREALARRERERGVCAFAKPFHLRPSGAEMSHA